MLKFYLLILVFCCSFSAPVVIGQETTYTVKNYGLNDGLPSNRIFAIIQHSSGFIYVGTAQGLHRFNGRTFSPVKVVHGNELITEGTILQGCETKEGKLLLMSSLTGIKSTSKYAVLYDPVSESLDSLTLEEYKVIWDESQKQQSGKLFISGLHRDEEGEYIRKAEDLYGNIFELTNDQEGKQSAILRLAKGEEIDLTNVLSTLTQPGIPTSHNLGDVIYFGGHSGLLKIAIHKSPFQVYLHEQGAEWEYLNVCRAMAVAGRDSILVSVEEKGLHLVNVATSTTSKVNFPPVPYKEDIEFHFFRYLWPDSSAYQIIGPHLVHAYNLDVRNKVFSRRIKGEQIFLAGSPLGANHYLLAREIAHQEAYQLQLYNRNSGEVRAVVFKRGNGVISKERPTFITPISDTSAWYATESGLFQIDIKNQEIKHLLLGRKDKEESYPFPVSYVLSESHVQVLHREGEEKLWIGLQGTGINVLDTKTMEVEYLSTENGLSNNTVVGLLPDKYGYWISTFNGLSYLDTTTMKFRNFYRSNGISHNEFNRFSSLVDESGRYFFGTMNGVTAFYPEEVLQRDERLTLLVSEIRHFNKKGEEIFITNMAFDPKQIVLPGTNRYVAVKMTLSDLNNPSGNTFFYRLEKANSDRVSPWKSLGADHEVEFQSLDAGHYRLILYGVSADGVSSNEVVIPIIVNELFYRTWWFIGGALLVLSALIYFFFRLRFRHALRLERLRTKISSDLHDDVGGLLSGVAFQMEALQHRVDPSIRPEIIQVARSSRKAMEQMRDTIWAIDPRRQTLGDLRDRMLESADEILGPLDIHYHIDTSALAPGTVLTAEVRHNLLLIYKEFVNNTIKHAGASKVEVTFLKREKTLEMIMQDDGVGMDNEGRKTTGQGLRNMEMRAAKMNGTLRFLPGEGFGICVTVPLMQTTPLGG